jgi:CelD/BcsL family acetyltransferase involved in cellulose biosynthesis/dTDP-4-amino-4,6-dideoxygalactose transaminase
LHGARALGLGEGDEVLVPAYHHGSEIQALIATGLVPRFYKTRPGLAPDLDELESLVSERTRALLLIHVLGLAQSTLPYRRWCDERGLLLLEDAAQGWLAEVDCAPIGWHADLALYCLYKTFGLPDGAVVLVRAGGLPEPPSREQGSGLTSAALATTAWLAQRSSVVGAGWSWLKRRRHTVFDPQSEISIGAPNEPMASAGEMLLRRLATIPAAAIRRAHYRLLLEQLSDLVPDEMPPLAEGAAPFAFPVYSERKNELLAGLREAGIHALNFWSVPHPAMNGMHDPVGSRLRGGVVGLPVHQELKFDDVERIAAHVAGAPVAHVSGAPPARVAEPTFSDVDGFDSHAEEWSALARASENVFATPEWLCAWWRHLGTGELSLQQLRAPSGRLAAILPLVRERRGSVRLLRFCSADVGDELGPICAPDDEPLVARAWRRFLDASAGDWDVALAERLPGRPAWPTLGRLRVLRREASPELGLAGLDWDGFLASRSSNFRQQLRRFERRLTRDYGLRFRLADDPDRLDADLDVLIALHRARWRSEGVDAFEGRRETFHREFARTALSRGWLRLWFAELNGAPAAAWYGLRYAGAEWYYNGGRDPAFDRERVGMVLMGHTVREAIRDGQDRYRLLRGDEEYKRRWATHDPGLDTAARAATPLGKAALAGLHTVLAIPSGVRGRVRVGRTGPARADNAARA